MNIALWAVQVLLGVAFIAAGGMKVFTYERYKVMSEKNGPSGLNHGLVAFIGFSEIAGAVGIVLPMAVNVAPWLSPAAATGLATVMLLAVFYHVRRHEPPTAPGMLFLLALFVAVGRFAHWA
jgi:uncharacterized membrane protein YphA (DoxX/SURF4 family)